MATVSVTHTPSFDGRIARAQWEGFIAADDVGEAVQMGTYADRSVQVLGSFGTSGAITIQGSNDGGTTWATLSDPAGGSLVFTAAGIKAISELVDRIRPIQSAGSGADIDVHLFLGGNRA